MYIFTAKLLITWLLHPWHQIKTFKQKNWHINPKIFTKDIYIANMLFAELFDAKTVLTKE